MRRQLRFLLLLLAPVLSAVAGTTVPDPVEELVGSFCLDCHDADNAKGDLDLETLLEAEIGPHSDSWERVVRQLHARQMPPVGKDRPEVAGYDKAAGLLESALDAHAEAHPDPGRTDTLRRLTRTEYQNAIRDLLGLEIDAAEFLPADEASHGFDNVTVGDLSPTFLDRYLSAAQKLARLAVGGDLGTPDGRTIRLAPDRTQEQHVKGLPLGTRGGALITNTFPLDGDYEIRVFLARDRNEHVEGLNRSQKMELLLDGEVAETFEIAPPKRKNDHTQVDAHLKKRISVGAGRRELGITFLQDRSSLEETLRQPYEAHFNTHRHPRLSPAVYQVTITGPFQSEGPGDTESRRRIFTEIPQTEAAETGVARRTLARLLRRAFRGPVEEDQLERVMAFYEEGRAEGGFEAGIESALSAILISREFLFRVERDPEAAAPGSPYALGSRELASRLSFFLWSSLPDEDLLAAVESDGLADPDTLATQARRLLADPRSRTLVTNFASQWLYLRNLESITPNGRLFPDFDDNLRQAMRRETELLFDTVQREDRNVLDLLKPDFTFLNERLAKHYGIPHIYGSRFRRVALDPESRRGGILRHASLLTVTSYATRTSPVLRGNWILENLLGTPAPPPPPDLPALEDNTVSAALPLRARLAEHRENPRCASCHDLMDPVGFALENFDAVGRWRDLEQGQPVDASGGLPDGTIFDGVAGLEAGLLARPEFFVRTLTERLLTYALGRGLEPSDAPAVRRIVRAAAEKDYRFSAIIEGIVRSEPFRMRRAE